MTPEQTASIEAQLNASPETAFLREVREALKDRDEARRELEESRRIWHEKRDELTAFTEKLVGVLAAATEKSEAFKRYVHQRLDAAGVPADPEPEANARHGCRIEGRLNYVLDEHRHVIHERALDRIASARERSSTGIHGEPKGESWKVREESLSKTVIEFAKHRVDFVCDACGLRQPWTGTVPAGHDVGAKHFGPDGRGGWHIETTCEAVTALTEHDEKLLAAERGKAAEWKKRAEGLQVVVDSAEANRTSARVTGINTGVAVANEAAAEKVTDAQHALAAAQARYAALRWVLDFYADPDTYAAISFLPDPPCGEFMEDWSVATRASDGEVRDFPGKRARIALATKPDDAALRALLGRLAVRVAGMSGDVALTAAIDDVLRGER